MWGRNGYEAIQLMRAFSRYEAAEQAGRSGAQYGMNWVQRYLLPAYLQRLQPVREAQRVHVAGLLASLEHERA